MVKELWRLPSIPNLELQRSYLTIPEISRVVSGETDYNLLIRDRTDNEKLICSVKASKVIKLELLDEIIRTGGDGVPYRNFCYGPLLSETYHLDQKLVSQPQLASMWGIAASLISQLHAFKFLEVRSKVGTSYFYHLDDIEAALKEDRVRSWLEYHNSTIVST
jgi:hypothetical protein